MPRKAISKAPPYDRRKGGSSREPAVAQPIGRPVRSSKRPGTGSRQYGGYPVPGYIANCLEQSKGVITRSMSDPAARHLRHSVFTCDHGGVSYLFNPNDSSAGVTTDGFERQHYVQQYQRPMLQRPSQIELSWESNLGECNEFSYNLSKFWHHPRHEKLSHKERNALFTHMVSVCVGAENTRQWHQDLWNYSI